MNTPEQNQLQVFEGKSKAFKLSSGRTLTIREKNGNDDDILSDMSNEDEDGKKSMFDNVHKFISAIVVNDNDNNKGYITTDEVTDMKISDKYQLLLLSRIHSDGPELNFKHVCDNPKCKSHKDKVKWDCYQDLNLYLKPGKDEDKDRPFPYRIFNHPHGMDTTFELTLSSAKKVRYKFLTGQGEYKALELVQNGGRVGKNLDLQMRDLEVWDGTQWQMVGGFEIFNGPEMRQLRASVEREDPQWKMFTDFQCPTCKQETVIPLILIPDFFYPSEI